MLRFKDNRITDSTANFHFMKKTIIALSFLILSSCTTTEARNKKEVSECLALGFKEGTEKFGDCRLQLRNIKAQRAIAGAVFATH